MQTCSHDTCSVLGGEVEAAASLDTLRLRLTDSFGQSNGVRPMHWNGVRNES